MCAAAFATLLLGAASGCLPERGELDMAGGATIAADCPIADEVVAEACDDVYCGGATVEVGTGGADFETVDEGELLPLHFGSNGGAGGYHLFLSMEAENLCPILWLEPRIEAEVDGRMVTLYSQRLHVLAVRPDQRFSRQGYWGIRAPIPCAFWPDDPERDATCGEFQSRYGHIEDLDIRVSMTVEDHDGRVAQDSRWVNAGLGFD